MNRFFKDQERGGAALYALMLIGVIGAMISVTNIRFSQTTQIVTEARTLSDNRYIASYISKKIDCTWTLKNCSTSNNTYSNVYTQEGASTQVFISPPSLVTQPDGSVKNVATQILGLNVRAFCKACDDCGLSHKTLTIEAFNLENPEERGKGYDLFSEEGHGCDGQ